MTTSDPPTLFPLAETPVESVVELTDRQRTIRRAWRSLLRARWPIAALLILAIVGFAAVAGPSIAPRDPNRQAIMARLKPPLSVDRQGNIDYVLGTDALGQDVLSRLIYGARISVVVGLTAVLIGGFLGTVLGLLAGYFGGGSTTSS